MDIVIEMSLVIDGIEYTNLRGNGDRVEIGGIEVDKNVEQPICIDRPGT